MLLTEVLFAVMDNASSATTEIPEQCSPIPNFIGSGGALASPVIAPGVVGRGRWRLSLSAALSQSLKSATQTEGSERLMAVAIDAWAKFPSMSSLRRQHVTQHLQKEMTYALIMSWQSTRMAEAVGWLLNQARERIERDAPQGAGRGQSADDAQVQFAPSLRSGDMPVDDGGQVLDGSQGCFAPIVANTNAGFDRRGGEAKFRADPSKLPPSASLKRQGEIQRERAKHTVAALISISRLDTVLIDGKKIGECTVREVREWAATRMADAHAAARDARFALSLVANLPSNAVIGEWWKDKDEVENLYKRAEHEYVA